jgi:hypothetical protein
MSSDSRTPLRACQQLFEGSLPPLKRLATVVLPVQFQQIERIEEDLIVVGLGVQPLALLGVIGLQQSARSCAQGRTALPRIVRSHLPPSLRVSGWLAFGGLTLRAL